MALNTEEQKLLLKVIGTQDVEDLTHKLKAEERTLHDLVQALKEGTISQAAFDRQVALTTSGVISTTKALDQAKKLTSDYRQNLMGLSYALNDVFSSGGNVEQKIMSMANNMPMLLAGFGGWGLALSAIIPMLTAITPLIRAAYEAWSGAEHGKAILALDKLKEKIKEIEKTPIKFAWQQEQLDRLTAGIEKIQKGLAAASSAEGLVGDAEQESGSAFRKAFGNTEGGSKRASEKMIEELTRQITERDPELGSLDRSRVSDKSIADLRAEEQRAKSAGAVQLEAEARKQAEAAESWNLDIDRKMNLRRKAIEKEGREKFGTKFDAATKGDEDAQISLAGLAYETGQDKLGNQIEENGPQRFRNAAEAARDFERQREEKANAEAAEAKNRLLNEQGRENWAEGEQAQRTQAETLQKNRVIGFKEAPKKAADQNEMIRARIAREIMRRSGGNMGWDEADAAAAQQIAGENQAAAGVGQANAKLDQFVQGNAQVNNELVSQLARQGQILDRANRIIQAQAHTLRQLGAQARNDGMCLLPN